MTNSGSNFQPEFAGPSLHRYWEDRDHQLESGRAVTAVTIAIAGPNFQPEFAGLRVQVAGARLVRCCHKYRRHQDQTAHQMGTPGLSTCCHWSYWTFGQ